MKAELAARLAERDITAAALEDTAELEKISRDALRQVREAVGGYRNGDLAGEVANARVALTAAGAYLTTDIDTRNCPQTHDNLYALVLREAVTNIVRHAGARHCNIKLRTARAWMAMLTIEDDGRGGRIREGNGIHGMRELGWLHWTAPWTSNPVVTARASWPALPLAGLGTDEEPQVQPLPGMLKNWRSAP